MSKIQIFYPKIWQNIDLDISVVGRRDRFIFSLVINISLSKDFLGLVLYKITGAALVHGENFRGIFLLSLIVNSLLLFVLEQLCFKKGDVITVTQCIDGGWWEGTLNGRTGWFPSNFTKEIKGGT